MATLKFRNPGPAAVAKIQPGEVGELDTSNPSVVLYATHGKLEGAEKAAKVWIKELRAKLEG